MEHNESLTDQMFGILESLLIENCSLTAALNLAKTYLPPAAQQELDALFRETLSDPEMLDTVANKIVRYRNQPLERTLEELRPVDRKND